uniref:Transmembrane protein n=1 Tax=Ascaris lumbricoides TaxID=6252 RepID=A0A0M3I3S2_ASCLU
MDKRTFVRTWLAFTVLQLIGNLWQCTNSKGFPAKMFREHAWNQVSPIVSRLFFVHNLLILVLRLCLIFWFDSRPLHVFHLACSTISMVYLALEAFYFLSLDSCVPVISQVVLSGVSVVIVLACKNAIFDDPPSTKSEKRKLTSKHFLTPLGNLSSLEETKKKQ